MSCQVFLIFTCLCTVVRGQFTEQDYDCIEDGVRGKCVDLRVCPSALKDIKLKIKPQICSFNGTSNLPNVCCVTPMSVKASLLSSMKTKECAPISQYSRGIPNPDKPINQGHKAWAKCLEYQKTAVFPCGPNGGRSDFCYINHPRERLIVGAGGIDADKGEFPHMALLGYGNDTSSAQWLCGGSLISEKFILTAAHCSATWEMVPVAFAAQRVLSRKEPAEDWDIYKIKTIIKHPGYQAPSKYNDIALLETDREVMFNPLVIPACLHTGDEVSDSRASATGWGALGTKLDLADILQSVPLWKVPDANCSSMYPPHRHLKTGYNRTTQVCYGDDGILRDTCRGDSGGPLNIMSQDIYCMHLIIGVTSFGFVSCGQVGYPGMYTRVAPYVPWIESIVWP